MPRGSRRYSRKPRYAWESSTFDPASVTSGSTSTAGLLSNAPADAIETLTAQGLTVVRIVGSLRVNSEDVALSVEWAAGISVIQNDAFNAGAVPSPLTSTAQKWMWWLSRVSPPVGAGGLSLQVDLDIKSKRKLDARDRLYFVIRNHDAVQSLEFALSVRVLVRLP